MSQPIRGQGGHLVFSDRPKNINFEILRLTKFRWIPFSGFTGEVENVSADQRLGRPSCFSDRPKNGHKLGRGRCGLAFYQVWLNSVKRFSEENSKMSQPIRGQIDHLVFPIDPKNTNFVEDVDILLPVKYCWILFSGLRREVENNSANQRPRRPSCFFPDRQKKNTHKLGRGCCFLPRSCFLSSFIEFRSAITGEMSQPIRG